MKTKIASALSLPILIAFLASGLTACGDGHTAEHAGEKVDKAVEKTKEAVEKAAEKTEEAVEKAVDKTKEALDDDKSKAK